MDEMSRRGSCFIRPSIQEEEEDVATVQQSMREQSSKEDARTSWVCSKFNISLTEKGVDVLGLGNIVKNQKKKNNLLICHMEAKKKSPKKTNKKKQPKQKTPPFLLGFTYKFGIPDCSWVKCAFWMSTLTPNFFLGPSLSLLSVTQRMREGRGIQWDLELWYSHLLT